MQFLLFLVLPFFCSPDCLLSVASTQLLSERSLSDFSSSSLTASTPKILTVSPNLSLRLLPRGEFLSLSLTVGVGGDSEPEESLKLRKGKNLDFSLGGGGGEVVAAVTTGVAVALVSVVPVQVLRVPEKENVNPDVGDEMCFSVVEEDDDSDHLSTGSASPSSAEVPTGGW